MPIDENFAEASKMLADATKNLRYLYSLSPQFWDSIVALLQAGAENVGGGDDEGGDDSGGDTETLLELHFDGDFLSATASIPVSELTAILENLPARIDFIYENGDSHGLMTCIKALTVTESRSETTTIEAEYIFGTVGNDDSGTWSLAPEMIFHVSSENGTIQDISVVRPDGEFTVVYIFDAIEGENANLIIPGILPPEG